MAHSYFIEFNLLYSPGGHLCGLKDFIFIVTSLEMDIYIFKNVNDNVNVHFHFRCLFPGTNYPGVHITGIVCDHCLHVDG